MPRTTNGIGTTYIGHKELDTQGCFTTTEWFVIMFFPIIPIRTYRVALMGTSNYGIRTSTQYLIVEKLSLDWSQVFTTYIMAILTIAAGVLGAYLIVIVTSPILQNLAWTFILAIIGFFLPIYIAGMYFFAPKP